MNKQIFEATLAPFFNWITEEEFDNHDCHEEGCSVCRKYYNQGRKMVYDKDNNPLNNVPNKSPVKNNAISIDDILHDDDFIDYMETKYSLRFGDGDETSDDAERWVYGMSERRLRVFYEKYDTKRLLEEQIRNEVEIEDSLN